MKPVFSASSQVPIILISGLISFFALAPANASQVSETGALWKSCDQGIAKFETEWNGLEAKVRAQLSATESTNKHPSPELHELARKFWPQDLADQEMNEAEASPCAMILHELNEGALNQPIHETRELYRTWKSCLALHYHSDVPELDQELTQCYDKLFGKKTVSNERLR